MPPTPPSQPDLAAALAGRVLHDIAGQASGLLAAFDLLADPGAAALKEEALALAEQSARRLARRLALQRAVLTSAEPLGAAEAEAAARDLFAESRLALTLCLPEQPDPLACRLLLGLLQIVQGSAAAGEVVASVVSVQGGSGIDVSVAGPRVRLREEERQGLAGEAPVDGQLHRWALAYWLWTMCRSVGGEIKTDPGDGRLSIIIRLGDAAC